MKNGANVVNLNEYKPVGTHWIPLDNSGTQFASFEPHSKRNQEIYWPQQYRSKYIQNTGL